MRKMKRIIFRTILLLVAMALWMICSHFCRGRLFWCTMIPLSSIFGAFFLVTRPRSVQNQTAGDGTRRKYKICDITLFIVSMISILISPFFSMLRLSQNSDGIISVTGWIIWLCILSMVTIILWNISLQTSTERLMHGKLLLGIQMFALLITVIYSFYELNFGSQLTMHKIVEMLGIAIIFSTFCAADGRMTNTGAKDVSIIFPASILTAICLCMALNIRLDTTAPESHYFTVVDLVDYHHGAICEMDTGEKFRYSYCPFLLGDVGEVEVHKGWFNEQFFVFKWDVVVEN